MFSSEQQDELLRLISDTYGSAETLANWLDLGVEMLFYVEEDTFFRVEIQEAATAIRGVVRVLRGSS